MKKVYSKPCIYMEKYSLSAHIAGNCGAGVNSGIIFGEPGFGDPYGCAWMYGETVMAYINPDHCGENTVDEVDDFLGYCYNSGADDVRIFSS